METLTVLRGWRNWGLGLLVLLNALDVLTTYIALHHGAVEGNPVTRSIIDHGFGWVIFWKALVLLVLAIGIIRIQSQRPLATLVAVWTVVGAYLMVVMINFSTLQHIV